MTSLHHPLTTTTPCRHPCRRPWSPAGLSLVCLGLLWSAAGLAALAQSGPAGPPSTAPAPPSTPPDTVVTGHDGPLFGLDVSHHQGIIDWARVAGSGHRFTFIKATEGLDWSDPRFAANWRDSGYAGLLRGAYHFFHADDDPDRQADAFLAVYQPAPGDLPPVVDVEVRDDVEPAALVARLERFLDRLEQATGRAPLLYTAPGFWDDLGVDAPGVSLWVAEYGVHSPDLPHGWQSWMFWQESRRGRIPGVPRPVDLDVFAGSLKQLEALRLGPIPEPPTPPTPPRRSPKPAGFGTGKGGEESTSPDLR